MNISDLVGPALSSSEYMKSRMSNIENSVKNQAVQFELYKKSMESKTADLEKKIEDSKYLNDHFMKTIKSLDKQVSSIKQKMDFEEKDNFKEEQKEEINNIKQSIFETQEKLSRIEEELDKKVKLMILQSKQEEDFDDFQDFADGENTSPNGAAASISGSPRKRFMANVQENLNRVENLLNDKIEKFDSRFKMLNTKVADVQKVQSEIVKEQCNKRIQSLDLKLKDIEHDFQVVKAGKHKIIDELIASMQEFKSLKCEHSKKLANIESFIDSLQHKFDISLCNFREFLNKTTDNFITEYKDIKSENECLSRELKRSLNDYRSVVSKMENADSHNVSQMKIEDHYKLKEYTNKNFSTLTNKHKKIESKSSQSKDINLSRTTIQISARNPINTSTHWMSTSFSNERDLSVRYNRPSLRRLRNKFVSRIGKMNSSRQEKKCNTKELLSNNTD